MATPKRIPITRNVKFFSREDFDLDIEMGREAIEGDGNFTAILYRVDHEKTDNDDNYAEASVGDIRFYPPVEIKIVPIVEEAVTKTYGNTGHLVNYEDGPFRFSIYVEQLKELDTDISRGDYIGYAVEETEMRFYSVVSDGKKNYDNPHTIMGWKGAFRTIVCAPVDDDEFKGE